MTLRKSKLFLVDLAGSERVDSMTDISRQRETSSINKSLTTLADVISALAKRGSGGGSGSNVPFVPYRNSVLTRLLKESLGGEAKTVLLATISPCCSHFEDTLSTLKFVGRAKNALSVSKTPSPASVCSRVSASELTESSTSLDLVDDLRREILDLKAKLHAPPPSDEIRSPTPLQFAWDSSPPPAVALNAAKLQSLSNRTSPVESMGTPGGVSGGVQSTPPSSTTPVDDAARWSLDDLPAVPPPPPALSSCGSIDEHEKARLERELAKLKMVLRKKERELDQLASQEKRPPVVLEDAQVQTDLPSAKTPRVRPPKKAQLDELFHSVVGEFVFSDSDEGRRAIAETIAPPQVTPDVPIPDYDEAQQRAMDCNTLSIIIDGFDGMADLEGGSPQDMCPIEGLTASPVVDDSGSIVDRRQAIDGKLAICLDSIDLARKSLGPTLHRLRSSVAAPAPTSSTGTERQLLVHLDKRLVALSRLAEELRANNDASGTDQAALGSGAATVFDMMEALVSGFCLHIMGRVTDQLLSGASGCSLGRMELDTQLQGFREQLAHLVQGVVAVVARGELHSQEQITIQLSVMELTSMCERIESVWDSISQSRRHQMVNRRVAAASADGTASLTAKLRDADARYRILSNSYDTQVLHAARLEAELSQLRASDEAYATHVAKLEAQLAEYEARFVDLACTNTSLSSSAMSQSERIGELEEQLTQLYKTIQAQSAAAPSGDEGSTVALPCDNLMVRLEEELATALFQMSTMGDTAHASSASPRLSARSSPSASPIDKISKPTLGMNSTEESTASPIGALADQQAQITLHDNEVNDDTSSHEDIGELQAAMERDLMAASAHEHELETQLSEALSQMCDLQAQNDALVGSVHSLNRELAEALSHVADLEEEKQQRDAETDEPKLANGDQEGINEQLAAELEQQLGVLRDERDTAVKQAEQLQVACAHYMNDVSSEREKCAQFEASLTAELSRREASDKLHEATVALLNDELATMVKDLERWREYHATETEANSNLRVRLEACETDRALAENARLELASLLELEQQRCQELTQQATTRIQDCDELRGKLADVQETLEEALIRTKSLDDEVSTHEATSAKQTDRVTSLEQELEMATAELAREKEESKVRDHEAEHRTSAMLRDIDSLHKQVVDLEGALAAVKGVAVEDYTARIQSLEAVVASKSDEVALTTAQLETTRTESRSEIDRLERALSAAMVEAQDAKQHYLDLLETSKADHEQLGRLQSKLTEQISDVEALEQQLMIANAALEQNQQQSNANQSRLLEELESSKLLISSMVAQLQSSDEERSSTARGLEDRAFTAEREAETLRTTILELEKDRAEQNEALRRVESVNCDIQDDLNVAVSRLSETNAKLLELELSQADRLAWSAGLEAHSHEMTRKLTTAQDSLLHANQWKDAWVRSVVQCGSLKIELAASRAEASELHHQVLTTSQMKDRERELHEQIRRYQQAYDEVEAVCERLKSENQQLCDQNSDYQEELRSLSVQVQEHAEEHADLTQRVQLLLDERQKLQDAVDLAATTLAEVKTEHERAWECQATQAQEREFENDARVAELESALENARKQQSQAREKEASLIAEFNRVNELSQDLSNKTNELQSHLDSEQERVRKLTGDLRDHEALIESLEAQIREQRDVIAEYAAADQQLKNQCQLLHSQLESAQHGGAAKNARLHELEAQARRASEWKDAWLSSIFRCGTMKAQLAAGQSEQLDLEHALARMSSHARDQDTSLQLMRAELQKNEQLREGVTATCERLKADLVTYQSECQSAREEARASMRSTHQWEDACARLMQLQETAAKEKRVLQDRADQSAARVSSLETECEELKASHAALAQELQIRYDTKVNELEAAIAVLSQESSANATQWRARQAELEADLEQMSEENRRLSALTDTANSVVAREREQSQVLASEVERLQSELAHSNASATRMSTHVDELNACIATQQAANDELSAQHQTLMKRTKHLEDDIRVAASEKQQLLDQQLEMHKAAREAVRTFTTRLAEADATNHMQRAELESFRWWVQAEAAMVHHPHPVDLLDEAVAAYSKDPSEDAKRAIMLHLSSLDEWFERTIVSGLPDDMSPSPASELYTASPGDTHTESPETDTAGEADTRKDHGDVRQLSELDILANELLELCSVAPAASRTDTFEAERVVPDEHDPEQAEQNIASESAKITPIAGEADNNNAVDESERERAASAVNLALKSSVADASSIGAEAEIARLK